MVDGDRSGHTSCLVCTFLGGEGGNLDKKRWYLVHFLSSSLTKWLSLSHLLFLNSVCGGTIFWNNWWDGGNWTGKSQEDIWFDKGSTLADDGPARNVCYTLKCRDSVDTVNACIIRSIYVHIWVRMAWEWLEHQLIFRGTTKIRKDDVIQNFWHLCGTHYTRSDPVVSFFWRGRWWGMGDGLMPSTKTPRFSQQRTSSEKAQCPTRANLLGISFLQVAEGLKPPIGSFNSCISIWLVLGDFRLCESFTMAPGLGFICCRWSGCCCLCSCDW